MNNTVYNFYPAKDRQIGLVSIPHSGENFTPELSDYLTDDIHLLSKDVDYAVDQLVDIQTLTEHGISVITANIHRTHIDLNRSEKLAVIAWPKNSHGQTLKIREPDTKLIEQCLEKYHRPYFNKLTGVLDELIEQDGHFNFVDLHSMPSKPTEYHLSITPNQASTRPNFCVSDIKGQSCSKEYINEMKNVLAAQYRDVNINDPYFGGHVTRHIHKLYQNHSKNNIQIEINRSIYMDEEKRKLIEKPAYELKKYLTKILIHHFEKFNQQKDA